MLSLWNGAVLFLTVLSVNSSSGQLNARQLSANPSSDSAGTSEALPAPPLSGLYDTGPLQTPTTSSDFPSSSTSSCDITLVASATSIECSGNVTYTNYIPTETEYETITETYTARDANNTLTIAPSYVTPPPFCYTFVTCLPASMSTTQPTVTVTKKITIPYLPQMTDPPSFDQPGDSSSAQRNTSENHEGGNNDNEGGGDEGLTPVTAGGITFSIDPTVAVISGKTYTIGTGATEETTTVINSQTVRIGTEGVSFPMTTVAPAAPAPVTTSTTSTSTGGADTLEKRLMSSGTTGAFLAVLLGLVGLI